MTSERASGRCIICIMYRARCTERITHTTLLRDGLASEKLPPTGPLCFNTELLKESVSPRARARNIIRIYFPKYIYFEHIISSLNPSRKSVYLECKCIDYFERLHRNAENRVLQEKWRRKGKSIIYS